MSTPRVSEENNSEANVSASSGVDSTPLLGEQIFRSRRFTRRPPSLRGAARFLRRASSRRLMRGPSARVRESATEQIEERQTDWSYSKPMVILDILWNTGFIIASISALIISRNESPSMPLRLWIIGYILQCSLHMICLAVEYRRRWQQRNLARDLRINNAVGGDRWNNESSSSESDVGEPGEYVSNATQGEDDTSVVKHLESANTMFSFIWWIIGFYWVNAGGQQLTNEAPKLYWLCITFLAVDVVFVVLCVAVACIIGIAVCCCLPCIIAILYAVADQEGASKEDIERLPKYKFRRIGDFEKQNGEIQESFGGIMTECDTDSPVDQVLPLEDAECCICLCSYDDGTELRELPCRHHFHCACIDKWLYINATCPLCKFNILKNRNQSGSEDV